ncbi:Lon protease family protein [Deferrisoma camini]|uniref:Lon protease family protein n=1 Tax=Deferrisoma camini TaxID=1035120 RepID=UPI00046D256C|nr:ATP-binding protein [Deferrisoma camini]
MKRRRARKPRELGPEQLGPVIRPEEFPFETTEDVEPRRSPLGQERALRSIRLGVRMRAPGYNVFVLGLTGNRKEAQLRDLVRECLPPLPPPPDWVYVYNFRDPDRPLALRLEPGEGRRLARNMEDLVETLRRKIPEAFQTETFEQEKEALSKKYDAQIRELRERFEASAREKGLVVQPTPQGQLLFIPLIDGKPIEDPSQYEALPEEEKARIREAQEALGREARDLFKRQKELMDALGREVQEIVKVYAARIVDPLIEAIRARYANPRVAEYLRAVRDHTLEHLEKFRQQEEKPQLPFPLPFLQAMQADRFLEYRVNVVVDNEGRESAPVLTEESPTYRNLFGAVEKVVDETGKLVTNFTRIKAGKILQASGGYLVFNLEDAITEPFVWKNLKRVLRSGLVEIESYQPLNFLSVAGLTPEPVPVDTRIVVYGSRLLFHILSYWDPEFSECFKVVADFGPDTDRNGEGVVAYAQRIAHICRVEGLPPFDRGGVAQVVWFGARRAEHKEKISAVLEDVDDLVREAGFFALEAGADRVGADHVRQALEDRIFRGNRVEERIRQLIAEGTLLVDVDGKKVGQVNGLAVLAIGDYAFGRPSRVTASLGMGTAGIVNIEREARLSGSTHDKGVLILAGYLRNRFGRNRPLSFSASLAFEQSYSGIDGDSASSTELYALLSRIGDLPLRQDLAVTGSVNQNGEIQAIGGVNEKIEGFYRVCKAVGLTGRQGVLIPEANVRHLVLDPEVVRAVAEGRFHIYPVRTVDQGMEILTGLRAGEPGEPGTVNGIVDQALEELDRRLRDRNQAKGAKQEEKETGPGGEDDEPGGAGPEPPPRPPEPEGNGTDR